MEKIRELWEIIAKASPAEKWEIIKQLDDETIIKLKSIPNPYRKPVYNSSAVFANVSHINTQRNYERNLMMTAMVAFIYKMASEFKHVAGALFPSELEGELGGEIARLKRKYSILKPNAFYEKIAKSTDKPIDYAIWQRARERMFDLLKEDYQKEYDRVIERASYDKTEEAQIAAKLAEEKLTNFKNQITISKENIKKTQKEYGIREEQIATREIYLDDEDILEITALAKKKFNILKTKEEHESDVQDMILSFLDYHFKYDPNNHIRAGYQPNYDAVIRERIKSNPELFKYTEDGKMIITDKFAEYLVPPIDTFASFKNYFDGNYEYLRQCTDDIYGEHNLFECGIMVYETFKTKDEAKKWTDKYRKDIMADVYTIKLMNWVFLDNFAENKKKIRGADDKMRLVDRIIEKNTEDEKIAQNLIKKRGKKMPNRAGSMPMSAASELSDMGVQHLDELADGTNASEKELEIKVFSTKLKRVGHRFIQVQDQFKFNIEAEDPTEVTAMTPTSYEQWKESAKGKEEKN